MSNYADNARFSQVAQEAQLAHYGLPTGGVPRPRQVSRSGESKGTTTPSRKPVQTRTARNQDGPYPSVTPTPARKPVGGYHTVSSSSIRPQSPPYAKSGGYAGRDKPLPPVPSAPKTFAPAQPLRRNPSVSKTPQPAHHLPRNPSVSQTPQPAPQPSQSRPGSSSGWSFRGRKRTDSNASNASGTSTANKSRSRGGSFSSITEAAKSTGKWFSRNAEIVAMNPKERKALFATSQRQHEQDLELKRQRGEKSRPLHQQQDFTRRSTGLDNVGPTVGAAGYQAHKEHEAERQRRALLYREQHARDCQEADRLGRRRPVTPAGANVSPPQRRDSFTPSMDDSAKARFGDTDSAANRPRPSHRWVKMLSEAVDPFKRKDSDASLFSDNAPPGSMDCCSKCGKAPEKALQHDLCENCYRARYFEPPIISVAARKKGHNPKSPEDDTKGVDLYMRLPNHRLRRVRDTMYEDPGNPFDFESYEDPPLLSAAYVEDNGWETDDSETWPLSGPEALQTSPRGERNITSVFSDPFDLANFHTDRETWSPFGSNRRSMSVDIGFLPMQGMIEGRRPSDFEPFWPLPVPTLQIQHPSGTLFTTDTKRDTKFYDFYDDLLAEYETEGKDDGMYYTQQALPIRL